MYAALMYCNITACGINGLLTLFSVAKHQVCFVATRTLAHGCTHVLTLEYVRLLSSQAVFAFQDAIYCLFLAE